MGAYTGGRTGPHPSQKHGTPNAGMHSKEPRLTPAEVLSGQALEDLKEFLKERSIPPQERSKTSRGHMGLVSKVLADPTIAGLPEGRTYEFFREVRLNGRNGGTPDIIAVSDDGRIYLIECTSNPNRIQNSTNQAKRGVRTLEQSRRVRATGICCYTLNRDPEIYHDIVTP